MTISDSKGLLQDLGLGSFLSDFAVFHLKTIFFFLFNINICIFFHLSNPSTHTPTLVVFIRMNCWALNL